jgi:hypothetical protein
MSESRPAQSSGRQDEAASCRQSKNRSHEILFASTRATGHLDPLLAISRILLAEGHEITFLTGTAFRAH